MYCSWALLLLLVLQVLRAAAMQGPPQVVGLTDAAWQQALQEQFESAGLIISSNVYDSNVLLAPELQQCIARHLARMQDGG